jgi:geranylgeranyl reductase family protein
MGMNNNEYDVVIIGGGPTGSICAICLKKLNQKLKVCIVDRQKFPRDKSCGDGLGPGVNQVITDLGLNHLFRDSTPIEKIIVTSPSGYEANSELPKMGKIKPLGFVIPRSKFDNELIIEARKHNVSIIEEYEITDFKDAGKYNTEVTIRKDSDDIIIKTKLLIGADGARSKVRRLLNIPYNSDSNTGIAIRFYCEMEGYNELSLRLDFLKELNPGYGWLFPVNTKFANVGVGIDVSKLKSRNLNLEEMLNSYVDYLGRKISIKLVEGSKLSYILPYGSQLPRLVNSNKILLGDAASMINPFTGEGIFYGMYAGKSLAEFISQKINDSGRQLDDALVKFEKDFRKRFISHYKTNNTTKYLMNSRFSNLAIKASNKDPEILKEGIELMMGDRRSMSLYNILKILVKGLF